MAQVSANKHRENCSFVALLWYYFWGVAVTKEEIRSNSCSVGVSARQNRASKEQWDEAWESTCRHY